MNAFDELEIPCGPTVPTITIPLYTYNQLLDSRDGLKYLCHTLLANLTKFSSTGGLYVDNVSTVNVLRVLCKEQLAERLKELEESCEN